MGEDAVQGCNIFTIDAADFFSTKPEVTVDRQTKTILVSLILLISSFN